MVGCGISSNASRREKPITIPTAHGLCDRVANFLEDMHKLCTCFGYPRIAQPLLQAAFDEFDSI
jgi:hypothetical protein